MAKKSVLLSLVILSVAALGATASAKLEGEPNCILIGGSSGPDCNCTTPGRIYRYLGSTTSYAWWTHTGQCAGEGEPCPWEYGGISETLHMTYWTDSGYCVKDVKFWWCVNPPAPVHLCKDGFCPDGPRNYYNSLFWTAMVFPCDNH